MLPELAIASPDDPAGGGVAPDRPVAVVAIGFSSGGLDALVRLFEAMPAGHGIAFVVVAHHHPQTPSLLPQILARHARMPVVTTETGMQIAPDRVHVVPPGAGAVVAAGRFELDGHRLRGRLVNPIDVLFRSIARERGRSAIGVVLSGAGRDGSAGIAAIRRAGGLTIAQDQASAAFPEMPLEAIATGAVDRVLELPDCAAAIVDHVEASRRSPVQTVAPAAGDDALYARILARVRELTGLDGTLYKPAVIRRRVAHRMRGRDVRSLAAYADALEVFPDEVEALGREILIGVTAFFRDPEAFDALGKALDELLAARPDGALVRVWVAGCARGQEAISVAILLREAMERSGRFRPVRIIATDVDPEAIDAARAGNYRRRELAGIAPERLRRFFHPTAEGARVDPDILDLIGFAPKELSAPPPLANLDLISFRNVLIYLRDDAQRDVLHAMSAALRPGGLLLLGRAETIGGLAPQFDAVDATWRLFRRRGGRPTCASPPPAARHPGAPPASVSSDERAAELQELQIVNQELRSMVDELRARNQELEVANADLAPRRD